MAHSAPVHPDICPQCKRPLRWEVIDDWDAYRSTKCLCGYAYVHENKEHYHHHNSRMRRTQAGERAAAVRKIKEMAQTQETDEAKARALNAAKSKEAEEAPPAPMRVTFGQRLKKLLTKKIF